MADPGKQRWTFLAIMCVALILAMTTWFSATAVIPELTSRWSLSPTEAAWLTNAVQAGFVAGALTSSLFGFADIMPLHRLMAIAAFCGAAANLLLLAEPGAAIAILARFATGFALANVYPPAVKMMATWFRKGRGLALGIVIGALTLGSATPHLVRAAGVSADWGIVVVASSVFSLVAAAIFAFALKEGPFPFAKTSVDPRQVGAILRDRPVMLANFGYFGHMWELYAMWGWFLAYARAAGHDGNSAFGLNVSLLTFAVVAAGVPGCIAGGLMSDRIGRCLTTSFMMTCSGICAAVIGFAFDGPSWLFLTVAIVWGVTVVGDSAQFSASVTELADQRLVGSALALQMGLGFGVTIVSIWLLPIVADAFGSWRWGFLLLVPGPVIGVFSMLALRRHPESVRMAGGLR